MTTFADLWAPGPDPLPEFIPSARYIAPMDCLIYLREDCSYRAVRLNAYTTVLLHPDEDRPVGVKFKGMHALHEKLRTILKATNDPRTELTGVHLVAYWELALSTDGEEQTTKAENERQRHLVLRTRKEIIESAEEIAKDEFLPMAA